MCGDWVRLMGEWWTCVRCCRRIDWTIELDATEWEVLEDWSMSCEACLTPEELQALCEEAEVVRGTDCERCRRRFEDGAFPDEVHGWIEVDDGGLICPGCQTYEDRVMDDFRTEIALLELDLARRQKPDLE